MATKTDDLKKETKEAAANAAPGTPETETPKADVKPAAVKKLTEAEVIKAANEQLKERVPYMAFKDDDKYKDDITIIVNGRNFIIKRGVIVNIPRYVVAVLESKDRELRSANKYIEEAEKRASY